MGRAPRSYTSDGIYHLTTHGVDDRPIARDDVDRQALALLLRRVALAFGWAIYAACLMETHYHLILRPKRAIVGDGMRDLNGGHSRLFNARHGRRGPVFEARYRSTPIADERH